MIKLAFLGIPISGHRDLHLPLLASWALNCFSLCAHISDEPACQITDLHEFFSCKMYWHAMPLLIQPQVKEIITGTTFYHEHGTGS